MRGDSADWSRIYAALAPQVAGIRRFGAASLDLAWVAAGRIAGSLRALREQARTGGLRFEAYLPGDMADWLLAQVEQGHFVDPSEAVFAIVKNFIEMEPHRDLRDELLRRILDASVVRGLEDVKAGRVRPAEEVFDELRRKMAEPRPEPARWAKIAR